MTAWGVVRVPAGAAWSRYVAAGLALIGLYYLLPVGGAAQAVLFLAAPVGAGLLAVRAARRSPRRARPVWWLIAAALALASASDLVYLTVPLVTGHPDPFPSAVDVLWLASYPCYVLAIQVLVRRRHEPDRRGNVLDVAIIGSSGAIPLLAYLIDPVADSTGTPWSAVVVSALYPSLDLLIFAMLVRCVVTARSTASMRLLVAAIAVMLAADVNYVFQLTHRSFGAGGISDALWLGSGVLVGAAALHPSAGRIADPPPEQEPRLTPRRMVFLGLAVLVGPAVLSTAPDDPVMIAALSSASFLLVMTRMGLLNHRLTAAQSQVARTSGLLRHQSLHDALTGLANRTLLLDRLEYMAAAARRGGTPLAALHVDLDGFTAVNDALGHEAGDRLLVAVADRLRTCLCDAPVVARLGSDEFVVLIDEPRLAAAPESVAERIQAVLRQPFELGGPAPTVISASAGVALGPCASAGELLRRADVALHAAKAAGRNRFERFRPELETVIRRRFGLELDLRGALGRGEFFLVYQPVFSADRSRLAGFEALLRWQHPVEGLVGPDEFVPLLEESGLIVEVGRWVLETAARQAAAWRAGGSELTISVNVSGRQFDDDGVVGQVAGVLRGSGLPPRALCVEITETALMNDVGETTRRLRELKRLGVGVAIDDFGTGYSSLAYLQRFPADCLKIDRAFTAGAGRSAEADAMLRTLVQLGRSLGLLTLAEGVETPAQLDRLQAEGVDLVQGFLLARPLPVDEATRLLRSPRPVLQGG